tara:strand:- start:503 stop:784 length:282 start_codon:yes stop_codon:yes gene_type:complete
MAMGPFKSVHNDYFQLGASNDTTAQDSVYVRLTNIDHDTAYVVRVRTTAEDDSTNVGATIIGCGESFIIKKEATQFISASSGNIYASPVSPRE